MTLEELISKFIPDGFSQEAQEIITAMVLKSYTETKDLGKQVEDTIKLFEAENPAFAVCPKCEGWGCSYCNFEGTYDPSDKEPDGTN
jgi:hypothetical protein